MKKFIDFVNENRLRDFVKKVKKAKEFAEKAHKGQKRRGGGDYISHPEAVARIVYEVKKSKKIADLIAACFLHDTIEDTDIEPKDIRKKFGEIVYSLVDELTSKDDELKEVGKEEYLTSKMLQMTSWGLVIKLADRLHNVSDIPDKIKSGTEKEKAWAKRYATQTKNIISTLESQRESLSRPQKTLISRIKEKIQDALD